MLLGLFVTNPSAELPPIFRYSCNTNSIQLEKWRDIFMCVHQKNDNVIQAGDRTHFLLSLKEAGVS